jgi:hypothetical protein
VLDLRRARMIERTGLGELLRDRFQFGFELLRRSRNGRETGDATISDEPPENQWGLFDLFLRIAAHARLARFLLARTAFFFRGDESYRPTLGFWLISSRMDGSGRRWLLVVGGEFLSSLSSLRAEPLVCADHLAQPHEARTTCTLISIAR